MHDLIDALMLALRLLCFALTAWTARWAWGGFVAMTRGSLALSAVALSGVFFYAVGTLTFQIRWLASAPAGVNLLSLVLVNIGLGLLAWANHRARAKGLQRIARIFERPDLALALIDLAAIDAEAAARLAHEARALAAERMARG